tara:strand:- start:1519 stop:2256 length:738 start_codon:yes stop_codon:yes gene_type:complete
MATEQERKKAETVAADVAAAERNGTLSAEHAERVQQEIENNPVFAEAMMNARAAGSGLDSLQNDLGGITSITEENMNESGNWVAAPNDVGGFAFKDHDVVQLVVLIGWRGKGSRGSPVLEGHGVSVKTATRNQALLSLTFDALARQGQRINWSDPRLKNVAAGLEHNIDLESISVMEKEKREFNDRVEAMVKKVKQKGHQSNLAEIGTELDSIAEQLIEAGVTGPFNGSKNTKVPKSASKAAFTW